MSRLARGFTLIEMLVVLTIIVTITLIALLGQSQFNRSLILTDTSYTLAFSIREAQSFGLSSRLFGGVQNAGYGLHFAASTPTAYVLFADTNPGASGNIRDAAICPGHTVGQGPDARPGDCAYTDPSTELVKTYSINKGFKIKSFCGPDLSGVERCSDTDLDSVDIVYLRPNTQSVISGIRSGVIIPLTSVTIKVVSPDAAFVRCIQVSKVGQVAVQNCS